MAQKMGEDHSYRVYVLLDIPQAGTYSVSALLVISASLLYPSERPGSLGMTPCFSHPFGGNHKFFLRCYTLTFFFFGCAGSSLLHRGFSLFAMSAGFSWASVLNARGLGSCHCWALENRLDSCGTRA